MNRKTKKLMNRFPKAMLLGVLSSFFFAFTFLLNRSVNLAGGDFMWSASLRYIITLPILALVLWRTTGFAGIMAQIRSRPKQWLIWSTVGFGLFYLPLSLGSVWGESWFVSASWELTIAAGVLLTPLFGKRIPVKNLLCSLVILAGVALLQTSHLAEGGFTVGQMLMTLLPILIAAVCYPLGNRKIMALCPEELGTMERVFGMVLCSLPFWLLTALIAFLRTGLPSGGQILKCASVALFSGTIATGLFFHATDLVRGDAGHLAAVESTQCGEVVFTLLGGILVLHDAVPSAAGFAGLFLVAAGMIANSLVKS